MSGEGNAGSQIVNINRQGVEYLGLLAGYLETIAAPFASGIVSPLNGGTGVANANTKTITLGGPVTYSGAFASTFTFTNTTSVTFPVSGTLAVVGNPLSQFAATTSAQLRGVLSDETGGGLAVFNDTPTLIAPVLGAATGTSVAVTAALTAFSGTAPPAAGAGAVGIKVSSTANFGFFVGSGAPTFTAAKGSYYARTDGSTTNDRGYIASDSAGTWVAVITAA